MKLSYQPNGPYIFNVIDLELTLKCNWHCKNCVRFCNMGKTTGLDYEDSTMTIGQIKNFIKQVKEIYREKKITVSDAIILSGGEPLLHPDVAEITFLLHKELLDTNLIQHLRINSNLVVKAPEELKKYILNFTPFNEKPNIHRAVLIHPDDLKEARPTYASCCTIPDNKRKVVLNKYGYSRCCDSDGYIRLFCEEDLIVDVLPSNENFLLDKMDKICQHCVFGCKTEKLEKDVGCPISKIYLEQAELNKAGRKINKIFPSI